MMDAGGPSPGNMPEQLAKEQGQQGHPEQHQMVVTNQMGAAVSLTKYILCLVFLLAYPELRRRCSWHSIVAALTEHSHYLPGFNGYGERIPKAHSRQSVHTDMPELELFVVSNADRPPQLLCGPEWLCLYTACE